MIDDGMIHDVPPSDESPAAQPAAETEAPLIDTREAEIEALTGQEVRVTVPGHTQRGGAPNPYDRVLSTRLGARAAKLIYDGKFGRMVVIRNNEITSIPLEESAGKLKVVDPNSSIVEEARLLGLSFGDR